MFFRLQIEVSASGQTVVLTSPHQDFLNKTAPLLFTQKVY
jgi:hypothetical protein